MNWLKLITIAILNLSTTVALSAQPFSAVSPNINLPYGTVAAWFSLNTDNLPDLIIDGGSGQKKIYENLGGLQFRETNLSVASDLTTWSFISVVDYNNDGFDDLLISGLSSSTLKTNLYKNASGAGFELAHSFIGVINGAADWADFNNDGNIDVFISGYSSINPPYEGLSKLYRGLGGNNFEEVAITFPALAAGSVKWGDVNKDGFKDLLITGLPNPNVYIGATYLFRNNAGVTFQELTSGLVGVGLSAGGDFADYDLDGDLDFFVAGRSSGDNSVILLYRNDQGIFNNTNLPISVRYPQKVRWIDYNNDGYQDLVVSENTERLSGGGFMGLTRLFRNNKDGSLTDVGAGLIGSSSTYWADADLDGDDDLLLIESAENNPEAGVFLYRNNNPLPLPTPTITPTTIPSQAILELTDCKTKVNKVSKVSESITCSVKNTGSILSQSFKMLVTARTSRKAKALTLSNKSFDQIPSGQIKKLTIKLKLKKSMKKGKYFLGLNIMSAEAASNKLEWQSKSSIKLN